MEIPSKTIDSEIPLVTETPVAPKPDFKANLLSKFGK